jgi:hypothetical protein
MNSIVNQENALNLLFEKNESEILKELALVNSDRDNCLSKINILQDKLKNNPSPVQINQKFEMISLSNYHNFSLSIQSSIDELETELKVVNDKLLTIQQELAKIHYKKNLFTNYFHNLKKENKKISDKKAESVIHDQYTHVKKFLNIHKR